MMNFLLIGFISQGLHQAPVHYKKNISNLSFLHANSSRPDFFSGFPAIPIFIL